jgi:hypothetical protein
MGDREEQRGFGRAAFGDDDFGQPLPPEYEHLRIGSRVHHAMYGDGRVVAIGTQPWPDTRVTVSFNQFGVKKLVLAQAKLELT